MPKRGENIRKRKDGRWEGRYKYGFDNNGKTKCKSVYGKSYTEVKVKMSSALQEITISDTSKCNKLNFEDVLHLWMKNNHIKFKGATENKYEYLIERHIVPALGSIRLSNLTTLCINSFMLKKLQNGRLDGSGGLSASYVRSMMLIITSAIDFTVAEKLRQPLNTKVNKPVARKNELQILTKEGQKRIETCFFRGLNLTKTGVMITLHTGLRIGEICALTWDDIDLTQEVIHVRTTVVRVKNDNPENDSKTKLMIDKPKTKASLRTIPISSVLLPILLQAKTQANSKYVVSDGSSFVSPRTYEYRFHRLLEACGVQSINQLSCVAAYLRHTLHRGRG